MKTSIRNIVIIALLLCAMAPAQARLGESAAELQKRFGPPLKALKQPNGGGLVQNQYRNHDLLIYVTLFNDVSVVEHYLKLKNVPANNEEPVLVTLPKELAAAILQASSEGSKWEQMGETDKDIKFARADHKALAVIIKQNQVPVELRICDIKFVEALAAPDGN